MKVKAASILLLSLAFARAQNTANTGAVLNAPQLMPNQQAFLNLPEESRTDFGKHLAEANRLFGQKRIFETLEEVYKAERIFGDSPEIYNLRGSCYVEFRAFDKALKDFEKANDYSKDNPSFEFNVAEVYFVTDQWQKAEEKYEKILKLIPADDKTQMALQRLVEFKLMLCKLKLGKKDEAAILSEKYDFLDDSPYYYYAHASMAYQAGEETKGEEWLAMAARVFTDPNTLAPWQDTLVEFDYIKSFYGNDAPEVGTDAGGEGKK